MSCVRLVNGQNSACGSYVRKYYQQAVLINKKDVEEYLILLPIFDGLPSKFCRYRLSFKLFENRRGIRFTAAETGNIINGSFSRSLKENIPQYRHLVQLPLFGVSQEAKCILHQLDYSEYFAVLQTYDNQIEVFGFENGLEPEDYEFNIQNSGGNIMALSSIPDALEDTQPLIYKNATNTEVEDFDNDFGDIPELIGGDFNDDFNDDFYIE